MEQLPTYQWSVFSPDRVQQWVVRADSFEGFIEAIAKMRSLLPEELVNVGKQQDREGAASPAPANFCVLHNKEMKLRTGKDGVTWYDHRWKEGDTWKQCNGERVRESA